MSTITGAGLYIGSPPTSKQPTPDTRQPATSSAENQGTQDPAITLVGPSAVYYITASTAKAQIEASKELERERQEKNAAEKRAEREQALKMAQEQLSTSAPVGPRRDSSEPRKTEPASNIVQVEGAEQQSAQPPEDAAGNASPGSTPAITSTRRLDVIA